MAGLRFILTVFLFAGVAQNQALNLKNAAQGVINTDKATGPDSNVKGRLLTIDEGCGLSKQPLKKIVAGAPAKKFAWPWVALLGQQFDNSTEIKFKCGGSLITSRHVLTAARCGVEKANMVRLGEYDLSTKSTVTEDIGIKRFVSHPEYNSELQLNDIAIVHLVRDVEFTDRIRPVCLPVFPPLKFRNFDDSNPFLVDWGFTSHGYPVSNVLLQDQITVLDKVKCRNEFKKHGIKPIDEEYCERIVCGGIEAQPKCQYDAGSPLMMPIFVQRDRPWFPIYQIGVTTFGYSCLAEHTPGIYASVQYYANWIIKELL